VAVTTIRRKASRWTAPATPTSPAGRSPATSPSPARSSPSPANRLPASTYFGGSATERGHGIAADDSGHAYVVGETSSKNDFPAGPGFSTSCTTTALGSCSNGFVAKLEPDGSDVVYSTYLGGSSLQQKSCGVVVDAMGDAVVVGVTRADDFPTQNAYQNEFKGFADFTITKFAPDGGSLVWSTYLGGSDADGDICTGIAMDAQGAVYITSRTFSADIPTTGGFQPDFAEGTTDGYVAKLSSGGALLWGTYLGGSGSDNPQDVFVAPDQSVYVVGFTGSTDFPLAGALQTERASNVDGFVSRISNDGSMVLFSSYLGGSDNDEAHAVAADATGNVFVAGYTKSDDFPDAVTFPGGSGSGIDGFIVKLGDAPPTTTTTTSMPGGEPVPGDANGDGVVTATDALVTLKAAVGTASCAACICDADGSGSISATDALLILKVAVGQQIELMTPACV
jgi:hypothetical protein